MASKTVCIFVAILAAFSTAQAEVFNVPCEFQIMGGADWYSCVISDITVPDENLEIVFVGEHLPGFGNSDVGWVDIRRSNIPFIMTQLFTTFPNLVILAHPTNLLRIHPNAFANASNLDQFSTQGNRELLAIPANAFAGAPNLRFLMIGHVFDGGAQTIDENAFNGLAHVETLILEGQDLSQLPINLFRSLKSVQRVSLAFNRLETIHGRLFEANPNLESINFGSNRINAIERNFLDGLPLLQTFTLSGNFCANINFWPGVTIETIREGLSDCFDNFDALNAATRKFFIKLRGHMTVRYENGTEIIRL